MVPEASTPGEGFGSLLRQLRLERRMSQEDLAERALVSVRAVSDLERGVNQRPRRHTARALADALQLEGPARERFDRAAFPEAAPGEFVGSSIHVGAPVSHGPRRPPVALAPIVGRKDELDRVIELLGASSNVRLVTLTGPGGVGKTRLAIEVMSILADDRDFIAFVSLAPLRDHTLLASAISDTLALDYSARSTPGEHVIASIGDRELLLVIDNLEHLLEASDYLAELLARCPNVQVLATSRSPLRIIGEHVLQLGPLDTPRSRRVDDIDELLLYPAVQLFLERAAAVAPHWQATDEQLVAVAELCTRLDGLPLALELAAARLRVLDPAGIVARLGRALDVLSAPRSGGVAHHQTMRAAFGWSFDLLPEPARDLFPRLSVFAGGCTLTDVQFLCDGAGHPLDEMTMLDAIEALADAALVRMLPEPAGDPRITTLEVTRQYGAELLEQVGEAGSVRRAFRDWALDLAARGDAGLSGSQQSTWLARLDADLPNLRAAVSIALQSDPPDAELVLAVGGHLWRLWDLRGLWAEAQAWLETALAVNGTEPANRALALKALGAIQRSRGQLSESRRTLDAAHDAYLNLGDALGAARVLNNLGNIEFDDGRYELALPLFVEAQRVFDAHDRTDLAVIGLNNVGLAQQHLGLARLGAGSLIASFRLAWAAGDRSAAARALDNLADGLQACGHRVWARSLHLRSTRLRAELGDLHGLTLSLEGLGASFAAFGDFDRAARLYGLAGRYRSDLGAPRQAHYERVWVRRRAEIEQRLGIDRVAQLLDVGAGLDVETVLGWEVGD